MKNYSTAARQAQRPNDDEEIREAGRDSQTLDEARTRQDAAIRKASNIIEFPTWRYCSDGRSAVVNDPLELKELEATGGSWADRPFPAGTEFVPDGHRTFAAPVGTVDARGAAARIDRPTTEVALTTALPRNVVGSVPSASAESTQRLQRQGASGKAMTSPTETILAKMQAQIADLQQANRDLQVRLTKQQQTDAKGQDRRAANAKKQTAKDKARTDARVKARQEAEVEQRAQNAERAEAQTQTVNEAAETARVAEGDTKPKARSHKKK